MTVIINSTIDIITSTLQPAPPTSKSALGQDLAILQELSKYELLFELDHSLSHRTISQIELKCGSLISSISDDKLMTKKGKQFGSLIQKARTAWENRNRTKQENFERAAMECAESNSPEDLLKIAQSSKESHTLLLEAQRLNKENLSVTFLPRLPSNASCDPRTGQIFILESLPFKEKVAYFIFELANLCQSSRFNAAENKVLSNEITDAETYAKVIERIEYDTCQIASKTIQSCIERSGWDPEMDPYVDYLDQEWSSFEGCYERQRNLKHTDYYIRQFALLQNIAQSTNA